MSSKNSLIEPFDLPANNFSDVANKFRIFRMEAESKEEKLKTANEVIEQLKVEITSSRDSEKNLRNQLSSAQSRLISLQKTLKNAIDVSGQQRQNEKISQQLEAKTEEISEAIKQIRDKSQNLLQRVTMEANFLSEIKNLKSVLEEKTKQHELMKMEVTALTIGKRNMEIANQQKLRDLETEMEKLKQREIESKATYSEILQYYQQQLEEKEKKLKVYERERNNFLDDFDIVADSEEAGSAEGCVKTIQTVPKETESNGSQRKVEERCLSNGEPKTFKRKNDERLSRMSYKPQLEFLTQTERKRRLFSTNNNHYE